MSSIELLSEPMPILRAEFHNGVLRAKAAGQLDKPDVEYWFKALRRYSSDYRQSIVVLIDATEVTFITSAARVMLAEATWFRGVQAILFIVGEPTMAQTIRVIGMLGDHKRIHAFQTMQEAQQFTAKALSIAAA
jgi:anti-anti-sigma regulatory factor